MSFRFKMFVLFPLVVVAAVAVVAIGVTVSTRRAFEQLDNQHTDAIVAQFKSEFSSQGDEIARRVQGIADAEATMRMALTLSRPSADESVYVSDATGLAKSHQLDFLELVDTNGAIISSAQWPARFGYKESWLLQKVDWSARGAFLKKIDTPDGPALALMAVSVVPVGSTNIYIAGGERLGSSFLASLALPEGTRALLYSNLDPNFSSADLTDVNGPVSQADRLASLIGRELQQPGNVTTTLQWTSDPASAEVFHALPITGPDNDLLAILLVGSSRRDLTLLEGRIRILAFYVGAIALLLGILLSSWAAARMTRPIGKLAAGAAAVASGDWNARVDIRSHDEIGSLARAFNHMTGQLAEQRERLVQAERVAAWRELARRLAHELKNPLFPLQITVENLRRAREQGANEFDDTFRESTSTLLAEIENLKTIVGRFSDFAKMPHPELHPVNLNEIVRGIVRLFEPRFAVVGQPAVTPELHLDEKLPVIQADATLLHRAVENLILNALDAMPAGGTLKIRTSRQENGVRLEISDSGAGLTREECERLFTPYYTTKQHGTGLGLAIVQSVVADHGGRISVSSEPGHGATFRIDLPARPAVAVAKAPPPVEPKPLFAKRGA